LSVLKSLRDHFVRIDARSLGLFRIAFGLVLLADLFARWQWARDFYSNEGVLPNHNHLFNLRGKQDVWSLFHAFSSPGEAHFALGVTLIVYLFFLVGYRTRLFHALALALLVSLTSRNILAENPGNYAAIALLAFTAFLPCGSRFSLDSLRRSMELRDEKGAPELNDRTPPRDEDVAAGRLPGWSPGSIAALGVLLQIATIYACSAMQQSGAAWRDGSALHYALHADLWVSGAGARVREALAPGALAAWTRAFHGVELVIPALLIVPALYRWTRTLAAALMVLHGLTLGVLFDFGLFGWSLAAAAALVVPGEAWDAVLGSSRSWREGRARTLLYDTDCGFCLWVARLLKRADLHGHLTFQGNDDISELFVRASPGAEALERVPMPAEVTTELVARTVIAIGPKGRVSTRGHAVTEALLALPLGWLALPLKLPGLSHALDALYDAVAVRRQRISVALGKEACAIDLPEEGEAEEGGGDVAKEIGSDAPVEAVGAVGPASPARRLARFLSGSLREAAAAIVLAAMLAQTAKANPVPGAAAVPQGKLLAAVASWPRMLARWDLLAPEPPRDNEMLVVDAQSRSEQEIDPMTGAAPEADLAARGPARRGQIWADYLARIHRKEWIDYQRAFRDYLVKGGPARSRVGGSGQLIGLDAYWVSAPIPPPGEPAAGGEATREKLFTHSRGGSGAGFERLPHARPGVVDKKE
jgi:predicted DCC family thiol-disulfide oxidoreductase YuxK